jgi:hypothetical protein
LAALAFVPATYLTALAGMAIERNWFAVGAFVRGRLKSLPARAWAQMLYALLPVDIVGAQGVSATTVAGGANVLVTLAHTLLLASLATLWISPWLAWVAPALGVLALLQELLRVQAAAATWPWAMALLALAYGLAAAGLRYGRRRNLSLFQEPRLQIWEAPLWWGGWLLSGASLMGMVAVGANVAGLTVRALLRQPLLTPADVPRVQMVVAVLAILGLFYLAAALAERWYWLGYGAVLLLLGAWSVEWLLLWNLREVQWYAIPAGVYLLGVGYLEWTAGSRTLARWIDRAALVLLLGSAFWQSLGADGTPYALLMGTEGLLVGWWGSTRRLRRFLYAGVAGVTLDVSGQLVEPLLSANRWIVFGVTGMLLVTLAILVERRLETVLALSEDVRERLERWE